MLFSPHRQCSGMCWQDGSMMKWGEIRSCERQNPTVSYEQILSNLGGPAQFDVTTPASAAELTPVVQKEGEGGRGGLVFWNKCSQERKSASLLVDKILLWLMLSSCGCNIPRRFKLHLVRMFSKSGLLFRTDVVDKTHLSLHKPRTIATENEIDDVK